VPAIVPEEGERKIDAVLRQLKEGVEGIQNSEQFRTFLTTMAKFHEYSLGNQILIALQKPEATRVAGFQTWKNLGRFVKKGEAGIAILAPIMPRKQKKEDEEDEESPLSPVYFKVVHVFDVSQTEGQPLPEFEVPSLTGEANEELFTKALALAKGQGLEVSFDPMPSQDPGLKGFYSGKKIWVKPDEPRAQQLKTLLHEMAHYYSEGVFRIPRADAETIAESAAFAVGAHFGFDSGIRSFPYVALWSQDPKVLKANLGSVRKVTSIMLEGLEDTKVGHYETIIPAFDETSGLRKREFDNRNKPRSEWIRREENKLVPALKPFEPYHFAEFVLRYNRFSDAEIPIYSGLTGKAPLRIPDHIWREVIEETEGEFIKQGELNVCQIPEKERPAYMRAAPTWRDIASTVPESHPVIPKGRYPEVENGIDQKLSTWAKELSVSLPNWYFAENVNFGYDPETKIIVLPSDLSNAVEGEDFKYLWFWIAHEFGHHYISDKKMDFKELFDEETYASDIATQLTTYQSGYAWKALHDLLPRIWKQEVAKEGKMRIGEDGKLYLNVEGEDIQLLPFNFKVANDPICYAKNVKSGKVERLSPVGHQKITILPSSPREELEFVADSPELIPFTIDDIGYRDKLDNAFEMAIAKVQGG